jgi:hypothetical protein
MIMKQIEGMGLTVDESLLLIIPQTVDQRNQDPRTVEVNTWRQDDGLLLHWIEEGI